MSENTRRPPTGGRRVRFFIETLTIRLALTALTSRILLRGRVNFTKLHKLVILLAADFRNEGALVSDIL